MAGHEATALHDRPEGVAWFAIPAQGGAGVIARAHTEAHDGGRLLPGHLATGNLEEMHTMMPPGLTFDPARGVGRRRSAWAGGGTDCPAERRRSLAQTEHWRQCQRLGSAPPLLRHHSAGAG